MPQETYVVATTDPGQVYYLTGYNLQDPPNSTFGNLENAIEYEELRDAETAAAAIGGGTVGTVKPH